MNGEIDETKIDTSQVKVKKEPAAFKLTKKQTIARRIYQDKQTNEILFGGGAGGGKSVLACLFLIEMCMQYPETRWVMGRATLKTLKETTFNTFMEVAKKNDIIQGKDWNFRNHESKIVFTNGSEILMKDLMYYPADPNYDELGSLEITGAIIDECQQITKRCKDILKSRIRFKLDEYNIIPKIIMTCNPSKGWVYEEFYRPAVANTLPSTKQYVSALATDNEHIASTYIESLKSLSEADYKRLGLGNWEYENDPTQMCDYENIVSIFSNRSALTGEKYIIADIARFGLDKTVIMAWNGLRITKCITIDKSDLTYVADTIMALQNEFEVPTGNLLVDEDGVGGGVKDIINKMKPNNCQGFIANTRAITIKGEKQNYFNLKSQCVYALAKEINSNTIYFNCLDDIVRGKIIEELEQIKAKNIDTDGKLQVINKDEIKRNINRSPDYLDTLTMRMYFELNVSKSTTSLSSKYEFLFNY